MEGLRSIKDRLLEAGVDVGNVSGVPSGIAIGTGFGVYTEDITIQDDEQGRVFFVSVAKRSGVVTHHDLPDAVKTDANGTKRIIDREEYLTSWQGERYRIVVEGE